MAQKKKKFTKEQVARKLGIQAYIMDAWEKQFEIQPAIKNGETIYTRKHLTQFKAVKELLYEKGFSMDAVKKHLQDHTNFEDTTLIAASPLKFDGPLEKAIASVQPKAKEVPSTSHSLKSPHIKDVTDQLLGIKEQLIKLSNSL